MFRMHEALLAMDRMLGKLVTEPPSYEEESYENEEEEEEQEADVEEDKQTRFETEEVYRTNLVRYVVIFLQEQYFALLSAEHQFGDTGSNDLSHRDQYLLAIQDEISHKVDFITLPENQAVFIDLAEQLINSENTDERDKNGIFDLLKDALEIIWPPPTPPA